MGGQIVGRPGEPKTADASVELRRFQYEDLLQFCCSVLERLGVPADGALQSAECLLEAELRGVDSHGLVRLPVYGKRIQAGVVKAKPAIHVERRFAAVAL